MYNEDLIETLVKLNSLTTGRDRIIRLLQYGSKFLWWFLQRIKSDPSLIVRIKDLEYSLSTGRKLFRLGRFIDNFHAALKTIHLSDLGLRTTITLSKISMSLYLLTDHMLWFSRVGLIGLDKTKWTHRSNQFWFLGIVFSLLRDLMDLRRVLQMQKTMESKQLQKSPKSIIQPLVKCVRNHKDLTVDTLKNVCDIFIPASSLGFVNLSPGTVGLLGVVSSALAIATLVDPVLKLQPN